MRKCVGGAQFLWDELIRCLLNTVVDEVVGVISPLQQVGANRLFQQSMNLRFCRAADQGKCGNARGITETCQLLDYFSVLRGKAGERTTMRSTRLSVYPLA